MIYAPIAVFNVQLALLTAFISAVIRAGTDLVRGQGKEWEYYLGYGFGAGALTTGIVGAQAVLYAVGAGTVKVFFETSPGATNARIFLDGVSEGDIDLADEIIDILEVIINIPDDGNYHEISILNLGTIELDDPTDWLAILAVETTLDALLAPAREIPMPYLTIAVRLQDAEEDTKEATVPLYIPDDATMAEVQTWFDAVAEEIDNLTESVITEANVTLPLTLPAGLKATPDAGAFNERGGLITFDTTGPRAASIRIPAMKKTIMPGNTFPLTGAVATFITRMTTTTLTIRPRTEQDDEYVTARKGSKSLRK